MQKDQKTRARKESAKEKRKKTEDPRRISSSELLLQIFVLGKVLRKPKF
jgi:hypothetical protein